MYTWFPWRRRTEDASVERRTSPDKREAVNAAQEHESRLDWLRTRTELILRNHNDRDPDTNGDPR